MAHELDLSRLAQLQQLLDSGLPQIVDTLVSELEGALADVGAALEQHDLDAAALGAHAARNSALMIDARPLLAGLDALESSARRCDPAGARQAHRRLGETWPRLRTQLRQAAAAHKP